MFDIKNCEISFSEKSTGKLEISRTNASTLATELLSVIYCRGELGLDADEIGRDAELYDLTDSW